MTTAATTDLAACLALLDEATPGEWRTNPVGRHIYIECRLRPYVHQEVAACGPTESSEQQEANADAIAEAVNYLRANRNRLLEIETAVAQAVELAEYVETHAKGKMEQAAKDFLSVPYANALRDRLLRAAAMLAAVESGEWKCVPVEATEAMLRAGVEGVYGPATYKCVSRTGTELYEQEADSNYTAMLAAAPPPPIESVSPWRPIETAPKDGTRVLLGRPEGDEDVGVSVCGYWLDELEDGVDYMGHDGGFTDVDYQCFHPRRSIGATASQYPGSQPTHWMPLPAAPAAPGVEG